MSISGSSTASSRLVVISYNGRCRRFDLDGEGRLSFAHMARVFRISISQPDDCDAWTLDDTSLRIEKSDSGALLTVSALRDLFFLPAGTVDQPLILQTDDSDEPITSPISRQTRAQGRSSLTPGRHTRGNQTLGGTNAGGSYRPSSSQRPSTTAAAASVASSPHPGACALATPPRPRHATTGTGAGYTTPGVASPLRGARTPVGPAAVVLSPPGLSLRRLPAPQLQLEASLPPDSSLLRHPQGTGIFMFSSDAVQHLPMLMACHLSPTPQRMLRAFSVAAQCVIMARAMVLYADTSDMEYFRDQRLEAAVTEARSRDPPQDHFCTYTKSVRLTGRKRKPIVSPLPAGVIGGGGGSGGGAATPPTTRGTVPCADVDMDAGGNWTFAGRGTLHCPGGPACRKSGRHENWLLSDSADCHVTYLPVLYDSEEHSTVLLPLSDPPTAASGGKLADGGDVPVVWFRYEYESRGGRRKHNFWDQGLSEHLEQAIRDVAGEEALRLARGTG